MQKGFPEKGHRPDPAQQPFPYFPYFPNPPNGPFWVKNGPRNGRKCPSLGPLCHPHLAFLRAAPSHTHHANFLFIDKEQANFWVGQSVCRSVCQWVGGKFSASFHMELCYFLSINRYTFASKVTCLYYSGTFSNLTLKVQWNLSIADMLNSGQPLNSGHHLRSQLHISFLNHLWIADTSE